MIAGLTLIRLPIHVLLRHQYSQLITRKYPLSSPCTPWAEGMVPNLKVEQCIYTEIKFDKKSYPTINVLLSTDVPGLGNAGSIVPVHPNRFWRHLYLAELAELPTDERIHEVRCYNQKRLNVLCGKSYILQQRLMNMTLQIPLNPNKKWSLSRTHVKVTFRKYGIMIEESSISLPKQLITNANFNVPFTVGVNIEDVTTVRVPCSIFFYQKLDKYTSTQASMNLTKLQIDDWTTDFSQASVLSPNLL